MKIKYLGTAAAEGIPALFCECEICKKARIEKGRNVRSRSQALINDDLLIDYPPDSFYHFLNNNIDLTKIHSLLITHIHYDHFFPADFECFLKGMSQPNKCLPFTIYGSKDIANNLKKYVESERNLGLNYQILSPYKTYNIEGYDITPLPATHGTENPYIYIISKDNKTLLYCHDSGLLKDDVYKFIQKQNIKFDFLSLDCTGGNMNIKMTSHMNLDNNKTVIDILKSINAVKINTKIVLNHFSHNAPGILYDEMCALVKEKKYIISYDGLEINL